MKNAQNDFIRALIVDDEQDARENLAYVLSDVGINVSVAGMAKDTAQAEKYIKTHEPDLVFLDIHMPGEDGICFLQRIGHIPVQVRRTLISSTSVPPTLLNPAIMTGL